MFEYRRRYLRRSIYTDEIERFARKYILITSWFEHSELFYDVKGASKYRL